MREKKYHIYLKRLPYAIKKAESERQRQRLILVLVLQCRVRKSCS